MTSAIWTRSFEIADYDAALELWKRVEGLEIAEGDSREAVGQYILRNPGLSRVATDRNKIVGVAMCGHDGRRGHIYHLAVEQGYQRSGLGKRLVNECLDGLRRCGIERAIIMVADDNPNGLSFWRSCGWEDIPGAVAMGIDL